jgi:hypothetical protein
VPKILVRNKELEQSHLCMGVSSYPQNHDDRYASYVLNTLLGGSMSSRLFQNVREKRGLAYAVFSGLSAYRDAGSFTVYAGCSNEAVGEVVDLIVEELRGVEDSAGAGRRAPALEGSLKGSLMLSLENTASRMSHWRGRRSTSIASSVSTNPQSASAGHDRRCAAGRGGFVPRPVRAATVLGNVNGLEIPRERLNLG